MPVMAMWMRPWFRHRAEDQKGKHIYAFRQTGGGAQIPAWSNTAATADRGIRCKMDTGIRRH